MSFRVAIVADDPLTRGGIAQLCAESDDLEAVGDGESDVVVCDAGVERVRELADSGQPVVALAEPRETRELFEAGARAVLGRDVAASELEAAIVAALRGLSVLDAGAREAAFAPRAEPPIFSGEALTPRELEVLALLAEGLSNRRIAARLGISENTVKFHVNALLEKLDADSRTEAVVRGARLGLVLL